MAAIPVTSAQWAAVLGQKEFECLRLGKFDERSEAPVPVRAADLNWPAQAEELDGQPVFRGLVNSHRVEFDPLPRDSQAPDESLQPKKEYTLFFDPLYYCGGCAAAGLSTPLFENRDRVEIGAGRPTFLGALDGVTNEPDATGLPCRVLCKTCGGFLGFMDSSPRFSSAPVLFFISESALEKCGRVFSIWTHEQVPLFSVFTKSVSPLSSSAAVTVTKRVLRNQKMDPDDPRLQARDKDGNQLLAPRVLKRRVQDGYAFYVCDPEVGTPPVHERFPETVSHLVSVNPTIVPPRTWALAQELIRCTMASFKEAKKDQVDTPES